MTLAAASDRRTAGGRRRAAGAISFLASDAALGIRTFVLDDRLSRGAKSLDGVVMATYTLAQHLLTQPAQTSRPLAAASASRRA